MTIYKELDTMQRFMVRIKSDPRLSCHLWIDGKFMRKGMDKGNHHIRIFEGARVSDIQMRRFAFSSIKLTGEALMLWSSNCSLFLGLDCDGNRCL